MLGVALIVVVLLLITAAVMGFPVVHSKFSQCPYCGARSDQTLLLGVSIRNRVTSSELTRYWMKNVDSHHAHAWVARCGQDNFGYGRLRDCIDCSRIRWILQDETAVCVLKALPSTRERKRFMNYLWDTSPGMSNEAQDRRTWMVHELRTAYHEDPNRSDWLALLKKHGYE